jgi:CO/xanthine dehydrogenase FAD-binding subunit
MQREEGRWRIGALVTVDRISLPLDPALAALGDAATGFGNPNIRRQATLGGNIAWLEGPGDLLVALIALDARVVLVPTGPVPAAEARGRLRAAAALVAGIEVAVPPGRISAFVRWSPRRASARCLAAVAVATDWRDGVATGVQFALGGALGEPCACPAAAQVLEGTALHPGAIEAAAMTVARCIEEALAAAPGAQPAQPASISARHAASAGAAVVRRALALLRRRIA